MEAALRGGEIPSGIPRPGQPRRGRSPCPRRSRRWWAGDVRRLHKTGSAPRSRSPTSSSPSASSTGTLGEGGVQVWHKPASLPPVPTGASQGSRGLWGTPKSLKPPGLGAPPISAQRAPHRKWPHGPAACGSGPGRWAPSPRSGSLPRPRASGCVIGAPAPSPAPGPSGVREGSGVHSRPRASPHSPQPQAGLGTFSLSHWNSTAWLLSASQARVRLSPSWLSGAAGLTRISDTSGDTAMVSAWAGRRGAR